MYLFEVKIKIVLKIILISSFHWSWLFSFFTQYVQGSEVISFGTSLLLLFMFLSKDSQLFPRIWYLLNVGLFKEMTVNPSWYFAAVLGSCILPKVLWLCVLSSLLFPVRPFLHDCIRPLVALLWFGFFQDNGFQGSFCIGHRCCVLILLKKPFTGSLCLGKV